MLKLILLTMYTLVNYSEKNLPIASRKKVFPAVAILFCWYYDSSDQDCHLYSKSLVIV